MNQKESRLHYLFQTLPVLTDRLLLNADPPASANFQFRFAITFRLCYFTPRADSAIMFHYIDCKIINRETCHLFFTEKQNHLFPHMTIPLFPFGKKNGLNFN